MQIKKYEGDYDKAEFYSLMGKFFAEPSYKKEMPYLSNKDGTIWFVAVDKEEVAGYGALIETNKMISLSHTYVEEKYRKKGLYDKLGKLRLEYAKGSGKTLETIVQDQRLIDYWMKKGFKIYQARGSYTYLRREAE